MRVTDWQANRAMKLPIKDSDGKWDLPVGYGMWALLGSLGFLCMQALQNLYTWVDDRLLLRCGKGHNVLLPAMPGVRDRVQQ